MADGLADHRDFDMSRGKPLGSCCFERPLNPCRRPRPYPRFKNAVRGSADMANDFWVGTTFGDPLPLKLASPPYLKANDLFNA